MKRLALILLPLVMCVGCASAIYKGGRFHDVLTTASVQSQIRSELGEPVESGEDRNFGVSAYDDFIVRGPVYDLSRAAGASMGAGMTFGLSEFVAVPQALWWVLTDRGCKRVRVLYTDDLHYKQHFVGDAERTSESRGQSNAEPDGAANGSQPIRSETNRTSSAAGSRR